MKVELEFRPASHPPEPWRHVLIVWPGQEEAVEALADFLELGFGAHSVISWTGTRPPASKSSCHRIWGTRPNSSLSR